MESIREKSNIPIATLKKKKKDRPSKIILHFGGTNNIVANSRSKVSVLGKVYKLFRIKGKTLPTNIYNKYRLFILLESWYKAKVIECFFFLFMIL